MAEPLSTETPKFHEEMPRPETEARIPEQEHALETGIKQGATDSESFEIEQPAAVIEHVSPAIRKIPDTASQAREEITDLEGLEFLVSKIGSAPATKEGSVSASDAMYEIFRHRRETK